MRRPLPALAVRFALALAAEASYLAGRTWLLRHGVPGVAQEITWTLWRLVFIAIYFGLFGAYLPKPGATRAARVAHPFLFVSLALVLSGAINHSPVTPGYSVILAVTAPVVALREEIFYRGIVQGFIARLAPPWVAIVVATAIFTAFHIGAQPMNAVSTTGIAAAGILLGAVYQRTANLWLVTGIHAFIDIVYAFGPPVALPPGPLVAANVLAMAFAIAWWRSSASRAG